MAMRGARVGFWQDDIRQLVEDLCALQPTIMFGVPRVFTRIYQKVGGLERLRCMCFETDEGVRRRRHEILPCAGAVPSSVRLPG